MYLKLDSSLENFYSAEYNSNPANEKYNTFVKIVTESIKSSTPNNNKKVSVQKYRNPVSWWDEECQDIKQKRKHTFKKWEKNKEMIDLYEYKRISAEAKKLFKSKKKGDYKKFAETLNINVSSTYTCNKAKILRNK